MKYICNSVRKIKLSGILIIIMSACFLFAGCQKGSGQKAQEDDVLPKSSESPTPAAVEIVSGPAAAEKSPEPVDEKKKDHKGEKRSRLTGKWIPKEEAKKRPYAIMINNISFVSPYHSGLSQASILYEALVEGGITRMMGIFENFDTDRIGSCRSARHYFASFADEYDAFYVHFGHTSYAMNKINALGIDNISGLSGLSDVAFYRDYSLEAPHNAFASSSGLIEAVKQSGYRTKYKKGSRSRFLFNKKDTVPKEGSKAPKVSIFYSSYACPYFQYNKKDKLYYNFQFGQKHCDANNKKQLCFKNLIIMFVEEWDIDNNGYQTMDIENASGEGYYITDNRAVGITWEKSEAGHKCTYYTEDGKELVLNPGKSYIGVVPSVNKPQVTFK